MQRILEQAPGLARVHILNFQTTDEGSEARLFITLVKKQFNLSSQIELFLLQERHRRSGTQFVVDRFRSFDTLVVYMK